MGTVISNLKARFGVDTSDFKSGLKDGEKAVERKAIDGVRVAAYREFYDSGGKLIKSEKLSEDYYKPVQGRVRIGADYNEAIKYLPSP